MASPTLIAVLSDVHIGDNSRTCWYQKKVHEPYLIAAFDKLLENAANLRELILLGDLVDFWTYTPDRSPPTFREIMEANPAIFGPDGKLSAMLTALEGRVSYLHGNHDINLTQEDLNLIENPHGYKITLQNDVYFPFGDDHRLLCTHGHLFTMFNAPDHLTPLRMPVGHFVTRAVAYHLDRILEDGQTVADLSGNGAPSTAGLFGGLFTQLLAEIASDPSPAHIIELLRNTNLPGTLLTAIQGATSISDEQVVVLPDGNQVPFGAAKELYALLLAQWVEQGMAGGSFMDGVLYANRAAQADADGTYMAWFAQKMAFETDAQLVITGHTHSAKLGIQNSLIQYMNCGYECPAVPDITNPGHHFNFGAIRLIDTETLQSINTAPQVQRVEQQGDAYVISPDDIGADSVVAHGGMDFSTYTIIENPTTHDWQLLSADLKNGYWIVPPPQQLRAGQRAICWAQDYPGIHGSDGQIKYSLVSQPSYFFTYSFDCPTGLYSNAASSTLGTIYAKSGDMTEWGAAGNVPRFGHPLFVKLVLSEDLFQRIDRFGCYNMIENHTAHDWHLDSQRLGNGYWVIAPPDVVRAGQSAVAWAQDNFGIHGSDGWYKYVANDNPSLSFTFNFDCPTGIYPNKADCNLGTIYAKSGDDEKWHAPGDVPHGGHPLYTKLVLT